MNNYSVSLVGPAPWGFRLQGGKDFNMPLTISRLSDGGKAANANVGIGDIVLSIDGISADGMTHLEAQNKIKTCTGKLTMNLQRTPAAPKPDPIPVQLVEPKDIVKPVPIASAVVPKVSSATNMAFNKAPRPFGAVSSPKVTSIPSPSSAFTPAHASASSRASPPPLATVTPPTFTASGLHANAKSNPGQRSPILSAAKPAVNVPWQPTHNASFNENAQEVTEGQRRGFKENQVDNKEQNGPPRKHVVYTNTEFYHPPTHSNHSKKRLIEDTEDWHPRTGTTQSRSFRILAQITGTEHMKEPEPDHSKKTKDSQTENGDWSFSTALMNGLETQYSSSVATQTCEISDVSEQPVLLSTTQREEANSASSVLLSDPAPSTAASFTKLSGTALSISSFKRKLPLENPLGSCLTLSAVTSTSLSSVIPSQVRNSAAAAVSTAVAIRARFSHQNTYRSLLDALLITPIIKPLPLESRPSRKSTSILDMQKNWTYDPLEPAQYTAATVKSMPENPENDVNRTASLSSASVPALKPAEPQYAVKTSGWQSSNQPAGSGWISNNSIGPGATVSSEKIAANVLTDEDTLVQRAEHIPAGKRTPMCAHCNQVIRGPFLVALGKSWHPEEFNCSHCKTSMAYIGFVEEKGALYCEGCYEKFFAPDCARCQRKILGEVINALKQTWHVSCFVCVACHKPIRNNVFHLEDGDPYCETDYYALFGTMCHGCEFPIEAGDRFLEALGHTWHDTCFVCSVCCDSLEGQTFFSKKDKPLCKKHAHSVNI
ncbi:PDZ and LIM domain protein 5 isoform X6 [Anolis carolinensis]|uniref:PDZ and LIM domain protein 5 isoform X6 n=1 Tax=Anolis carolinensis TaxID=28377 RepID=UPI00046284BD|nr:PREDICTED: PDZ and LIM domain protein 5 isoform X5 [Anolis carolinensis]|eukprot:XP_008109268.1 PREDICTED: PDZ and LIM domain protein 5 isoform X5 [Anolis carolinensis]